MSSGCNKITPKRGTLLLCVLVFINLFVSGASAGLMDSLMSGGKKATKNAKKMTRDQKRQNSEHFAQDVMADSKIKDTKQRAVNANQSGTKSDSSQESTYQYDPSQPYKPPKGNIEEVMIPEDMLDPLPSERLMNAQWEQQMHNFFPEDWIKFTLNAKTTQTYHFELTEDKAVHIRGAYYVNAGSEDRESQRINCVVLDPNNEVIFKRNFMDMGIIAFDAGVIGEYTFTFSSYGLKGGDKQILFMLHEDYLEAPAPGFTYPDDYQYIDHHEKLKEIEASQEQEVEQEEEVTAEEAAILADQLETQDIASLKAYMRSTLDDLRKIKQESKWSLDRQAGHNNTVNDNQNFFYYCMVIEVAGLLAIAAVYVRSIQNMLENKLLL